jgi:hypothetical protein
MQSCPELLGVFLGASMNTLQTLEALAAAYSDDPRTRLAYHVGLLQGHIRKQDHLIEILEQEVRQLILEINQEKA